MSATYNQQAKEISKNLYAALDKMRGKVPVQELIEPIVLLAVVRKLESEVFEHLFKLPVVNQKNELMEAVLRSELLRGFEFYAIQRDVFTADMLQTLIYFVNEVASMSVLADVIYSVYESVSGRQGGEVVTSGVLTDIIESFVGDVSQSVVFDGAAGLGTVVSNLNAKYLLLGEMALSTRNIGQCLLTLKGKQFEYRAGDSLVTCKESAKADWVIMQPPWGMRKHAEELLNISNAPFIAFDKGGKLPTSSSDALWIQYALYNANERGRVVLVMPQGWTFRGGYDAKLRKYLLDNDLVESITALPAGIHSFTNIPSHILVLNKSKPKDMQGTINFIDVSALGIRDSRKFHLSKEDLLLISELMHEGKEHRLLKQVLLPEVYQNNYNLNIKNYFADTSEFELPDYEVEKNKLLEMKKIAEKSQINLEKVLS